MLALVSNKAKSNELITRNTRHFEGLAVNVAWPLIHWPPYFWPS
jgi:hypothetical protein